jgi:hypothetical protein
MSWRSRALTVGAIQSLVFIAVFIAPCALLLLAYRYDFLPILFLLSVLTLWT